MKSIISKIVAASLCLVLFACKEDCSTTIKYGTSKDLTLKIGKSVETFYGHKIELLDIVFEKSAPLDTLVSRDSALSAKYCKIQAKNWDSSKTSQFLTPVGGDFSFGNSKPGDAYSHIKIVCKSISVKDSSVTLTSWNSTFLQDCNGW
jgi:hypothetical protein